MRIFQDEVEVGILPDTARCKLACNNPFDIDECPIGEEFCSGNCFYYTEDPEDAKTLDQMDNCDDYSFNKEE